MVLPSGTALVVPAASGRKRPRDGRHNSCCAWWQYHPLQRRPYRGQFLYSTMAARPLGRLFMLLCGLILIGLCFQYHGLSENLGYVDTASKGKYEHDTPQYINSNRYHMERINDRTLEITTPVADPRSQGATQTPRTRYEALPEPQSGSCPKIPPFLGRSMFLGFFFLVSFKKIQNDVKCICGKIPVYQ